MSPSNYNCGKRMRTTSHKNMSSTLTNNTNGSLFLQRSPQDKLNEASSRPTAEISLFVSGDQKSNKLHNGGNTHKCNSSTNNLNLDLGIPAAASETSRARIPNSPPSMPRLKLKPKASFRGASLKSFTPLRSAGSQITLDGKNNDINMGIKSPMRHPGAKKRIDRLVLSIPRSNNPAVDASSFSPKPQTFSHDIAFLHPSSSQENKMHNQTLLISSPPKRPSRIAHVPATSQRRKKPHGYQQAGRDDAEEAEDSNGDGDNRCYYSSKNNPFAPRDRAFSDTPDQDSKSLNFGIAPKRLSADDLRFTSPVKGGRNQYLSNVATPKKTSIAGFSKNTYPFSPNPFSPHFSPIPQSQQNHPTADTSFSPIKQSTFLPSLPPMRAATPKKQHTSLPKTPRGRRGQPMLDIGTQNDSFDSNSVNSANCNMSVSTSITNDIDYNHHNRPQAGQHLNNKNGQNENGYSLDYTSNIQFTGSPIFEHDTPGRMDNKSKPNKSFDSTISSPTPSESTVNMSFDMNSTDNNLSENRHQINLKIDCQHLDLSSDKSKRPFHDKGVSPVEVQHFPPPNTPCKHRSKYALTPRRERTARPKNRHRNTNSLEREDMYNFLHTNNMQIDVHADSSSNSNYANSPSSASTSASGYPQQQFSSSRFATDFEEVGQLGSGSFGTVFKCMSRLDGCIYAIKIAKRKAKGKTDLERMKTEVYAMAAICDKPDTGTFHIVRYHQAWLEDDRLYMQTELCDSTLAEEMKSTKLFRNAARKYKLLREMLLALSLIHRENMVHLDIKPENIFIKGDQYKLGDFGLVAKATTEGHVEEGDSRYMSLELLDGDHLDLTKSDIFSLGATLYEVCIDEALPADGEGWHKIRNDKLDFNTTLPSSSTPATAALNTSNNTPKELQEILRSMMSRNPSSRPSATELLRKRPLLSEQEKQLIAEKNKVKSLEEQKFQTSFSNNRNKKRLVRSSTWDAGYLFR